MAIPLKRTSSGKTQDRNAGKQGKAQDRGCWIAASLKKLRPPDNNIKKQKRVRQMAKIRYNPNIAENTWFVKSKTKFSCSGQQLYFGYCPKRGDHEKGACVHTVSVGICEQM